jgi:hypothetical protein
MLSAGAPTGFLLVPGCDDVLRLRRCSGPPSAFSIQALHFPLTLRVRPTINGFSSVSWRGGTIHGRPKRAHVPACVPIPSCWCPRGHPSCLICSARSVPQTFLRMPVWTSRWPSRSYQCAHHSRRTSRGTGALRSVPYPGSVRKLLAARIRRELGRRLIDSTRACPNERLASECHKADLQSPPPARASATAPASKLVTRRVPEWGADGVFTFLRGWIDIPIPEDPNDTCTEPLRPATSRLARTSTSWRLPFSGHSLQHSDPRSLPSRTNPIS